MVDKLLKQLGHSEELLQFMKDTKYDSIVDTTNPMMFNDEIISYGSSEVFIIKESEQPFNYVYSEL